MIVPPSCICVTLINCTTQEFVYYYTCKQTQANIDFLDSLSIGQLLEIYDNTNFPDTFYTYRGHCFATAAGCNSCVSQPNRIDDDNATSLAFWSISSQLICPTLNSANDVYLLTNCLANITTPNVDTFTDNPAFALFTSTDLSLYVDMIVSIDGPETSKHKSS